MKTIRLILLLSVISFTATPVNAQFWKKLQKRVEKSVERTVLNKAEEKSRKATDDAIEGVLGNKKRNGTTRNESPSYENRQQEEAPMPTHVPQTYTFNKSLMYEITNHHQDERPMHMTTQYYFHTKNPNALAIETEWKGSPHKGENKMTYVITTEGASLLMSDGENTHPIAISKDLIKSIDIDKFLGESKITKTGNKQRILGYWCDEFIQTTDDGTFIMWVSRVPVINTNLTEFLTTKQKDIFGEGIVLKGKYTTPEGTMYMEAKKLSSVHKTITQ